METAPITNVEDEIVSILLKPISGESVVWLLAGHGDASAQNAQMWLTTLARVVSHICAFCAEASP